MTHYTEQRGFTLAEMMATLAITAITASMAIPSMKAIIANGQRAADTNELVATMHAARSAAITRNVQVTVCASNDAAHCNDAQWQEGWIFFVDYDQNRNVNGNDEILGTVSNIGDVTIKSHEFERFLAYRPNGQIMVNSTAENSGEMLLCDQRGPDFSRSLILHVGGKAQLAVNEAADAYAACFPA